MSKYSQFDKRQDSVNEKKMYKILYISDSGLYPLDAQKYYTVFIIIINRPI